MFVQPLLILPLGTSGRAWINLPHSLPSGNSRQHQVVPEASLLQAEQTQQPQPALEYPVFQPLTGLVVLLQDSIHVLNVLLVLEIPRHIAESCSARHPLGSQGFFWRTASWPILASWGYSVPKGDSGDCRVPLAEASAAVPAEPAEPGWGGDGVSPNPAVTRLLRSHGAACA